MCTSTWHGSKSLLLSGCSPLLHRVLTVPFLEAKGVRRTTKEGTYLHQKNIFLWQPLSVNLRKPSPPWEQLPTKVIVSATSYIPPILELKKYTCHTTAKPFLLSPINPNIFWVIFKANAFKSEINYWSHMGNIKVNEWCLLLHLFLSHQSAKTLADILPVFHL